MRVGAISGILHRVVFQARYRYGFAYLDRCGRFINKIMQKNPDWIVNAAVTTGGTALANVSSGVTFTFTPDNYAFSMEQRSGQEELTQDDITRFIDDAEFLSPLYHQEMDLKEFTREGFREWFLFATKSKDESQERIRNLGLFTTSPSLASAFSGKTEAESHSAIVRNPDCSFMVTIAGVEQQMQIDLGESILSIDTHRVMSEKRRDLLIKKEHVRKRIRANPSFAIQIDVDAFVEEPEDVVPPDFIRRNAESIETMLGKIA